jgi:hypothetical protein
MSLHMNAEMARLTVLGTGWSNTAIDSGAGFTIDGQLWDDIATDLDYDFGGDVDWDLIADTEFPDMDWSQVIYTDPDGNIYTDPDGDGIWTDPLTGLEYPGGGEMWIPEDMLIDISDLLNDIAISDSALGQYSIPNDVLPSLFGGKVTTEIHQTVSGSDRPHYYTPPVWFIQNGSSNGIIFLDEPFFHGTASGGSITVYDEAITIRDGSSKEVYWSGCTTQFSTSYLPSPYNSYPIQYVCWQCLYGSLSDALISTNPNTVTSEDIRNGDSGLPTMNYGGGTYYKTTR